MTSMLKGKEFFLGIFFSTLACATSIMAQSRCVNKTDALYDFDENCRCDTKAKPWLDNECRMPSIYNPNHACRIATYVDYHGKNPLDPKLSISLHVGNDVIDNAVKTCDEVRRNTCLAIELTRHQSYWSIVKPIFVDFKADKNNFNAQSIFLEISEKNLQIQEQIDHVSDRMSAKIALISTKDSVKDSIKQLYSEMQPIRRSLAELSKLEERLALGLGSVSSKLAQLEYKSMYAKLGFDCQVYSKESDAQYVQEINALYKSINDYRTSTQYQRTQTNKLYNLAYYSWTFAAYKKYADATGEMIDSSIDELNRFLKLDSLLWQFDDWWVESTVNGLASNMHTRFFFHTEPLRILKIKKQEAENFKDRIRIFEGIDKSASEEAIKLIDSKIAVIQKEIDWITSKGWQGLLLRQRQAAEKRAALLPNNQKCQDVSKSFLQKANVINSLHDFDMISTVYKETATTCVK